jgi:hypothetical protein
VKLWERLKAYREAHNYPWFTAPWDLNLFVLRSGEVGKWDDLAVVTCVDEAGRQVVQRVRCTSDAWEGEWTDPTHPDGCLYVLDQHVAGGLQLGEHRGRPALRQRKPFSYVRWPADGTVPTVEQLEAHASTSSFSAVRGTHLHNNWDGRAPVKPRPGESEGCTVSLWRHQHAALIELTKQQEFFLGSSVVSVTYLKKAALRGILDVD